MDQNLDSIMLSSNETHKHHQFLKKTLQFFIPVSFISFLVSYTLGFSFFLPYNLQISSLVLPLVAHVLDRKYMFLICNGILAFLARSLRFGNSCSSPEYDKIVSSIDTEVKPMLDVPEVKDEPVEGDEASMKYSTTDDLEAAQDEQKEEEQKKGNDECLEEDDKRENATLIVDEEDEDEDKEEDHVEEGGAQEGALSLEEGNDVNINTEELNKKIEEFIRKMKEEIRIEAQQPLIAVESQVGS